MNLAVVISKLVEDCAAALNHEGSFLILFNILIYTYIYVCVCVCGWVGEEKGVYRFFLGKPEGRRPLGRPRSIWVDNIRMWDVFIWTGLDWPWIETGGRRL